jgi:uncharacterized membrane protein YjgN (DUF898 family)
MKKTIRPILLVFIIVNALLIVFRKAITSKGVDADVCIVGNLLMCAVTILSIFMIQKNLKSDNPHAFVRGVNGSVLMKLMICAGVAFVYIFAVGSNNVNAPALFAFMGFYIIYTFLEVRILTALNKEKNNG